MIEMKMDWGSNCFNCGHAEAVTLDEWDLSADEHSKYLEENPNWWEETTFLDDEVA